MLDEKPVFVDLTQTNIHPEDYQPLLEDLQGNILQGYEQDYAVHIFIKFKSDSNAVRKWIRRFAEDYVTSAQQQLDYSNAYKANQCFANFFLSAQGYQALGFQLKGKRGTFPAWAFLSGMKVFQKGLNDPPVKEWETGFQEDIDALILLSNDDTNNLQQQVIKVMEEVSSIASIINSEVGSVLRNNKIQPNGKGQAIEHFGFRDGISQPLFFKQDIEQAKAEGLNQWNPSAPLELVLVKDPFGQGTHSYGSYCVYRKLEQNVSGFREAEQQLAQTLGLVGKEAERAGALIVGRFRDGTPIALSPIEQGDALTLNNFNYADDIEGAKCPFHAHIRKTNPRGETGNTLESSDEQRLHRVVRRAITYGGTEVGQALQSAILQSQHQLNPLNQKTLQTEEKDKVGLLFLCFQSNIFDQFLTMQKIWANQRDFVQYGAGIDTVIGQAEEDIKEQNWPNQWGKSGNVSFHFANFVKMKGGEFFFAPSISFLKRIESCSVREIS